MGHCIVWPEVTDTQPIIYRDASKSEDRVMTLYSLITELAQEGKINPAEVILPFHNHTYTPTSNTNRCLHKFTPTFECAWVAKRTSLKTELPKEADASRLSSVNILSAMGALPRSTSKHQVGLRRSTGTGVRDWDWGDWG